MYQILIADDEPIERMVLAKKLNTMFSDQIRVVQAENGQDAVELYEKEACRIAILDINMPGMNGLEAARIIRKAHKECVLIFLTAYNEFDYAKQAIYVKALDYLLKPGSDEELETAVGEALRLVQEQDEHHKDDKPEVRVADTEGAVTTSEENENVRLKVISLEILTYISDHYQADIALQDISGALGYSEAYFCKIFRQCFSKSFTGYLTEYRIQMAKELLQDIHVNIKDVSARVGIRDSNYFARIFKKNAGCTPSEYRNQVLSGSRP